MIDTERRVYTPPLDSGEFTLSEEGDLKRKWMVGAIMAIVIGAVGAVAWNTYGNSGAPPLITVASRDFKTMAAPDAAPPAAEPELYNAIEGAAPPPLTTSAAPSAEEPLATAAAPTAPTAPVAPAAASAPTVPLAQGGYLVQIAALRSQDAAEEAWRIFYARAPGLARDARKDIQRADLGPQGIYYRLRAGYFDTRERASSYCAKAQSQGQNCMVVAR